MDRAVSILDHLFMLYLPIFDSRTDKYDTYSLGKKYSVHRIFECIVTALHLSITCSRGALKVAI